MLHTPVKHFIITPPCPHLRTNPDFLAFEPTLATIATHVAIVARRVAMTATRQKIILWALAMVARRVATTATRQKIILWALATAARRVAMTATRQKIILRALATVARRVATTATRHFTLFFRQNSIFSPVCTKAWPPAGSSDAPTFWQAVQVCTHKIKHYG